MTEDEITDIKESKGGFKKCSRCNRWLKKSYTGSRCETCMGATLAQITADREKKKESKIRCIGITRNNTQCPTTPPKDNKYCEDRLRFEEYTKDVFDNLTECSGCHNMFCFPADVNGHKNKQCKKCNNIGKINSDTDKKKLTVNDMCKYEKCNFKASDKFKYDLYCGKHQLHAHIIYLNDVGTPPCANIRRSCLNLLDLTEKISTCETCLELYRISDKIKRDQKRDTLSLNKNIEPDFYDSDSDSDDMPEIFVSTLKLKSKKNIKTDTAEESNQQKK